MIFISRACLVVLLAVATDFTKCSVSLSSAQLQPEDRRLLDDVVKKSSRTAEITMDLVRQVQQLASSVTAAVDSLKKKTNHIERLEQKVDVVSKEVVTMSQQIGVIKEKQSVCSGVAEETNKKLADLAKHTSKQLARFESSVFYNISNSIQDMTKTELQGLTSSVTSAIDDLKNKTKDMKELAQKVDGISKEVGSISKHVADMKKGVAVVEERQSSFTFAAEETNKDLTEIARHSSQQLDRLESFVLHNISNSIRDITNVAEEKFKEIQLSVKKLPEQIGKTTWVKSLHMSVRSGMRKYWLIKNVTEHDKKNDALYSDKFLVAGYTVKFKALFYAGLFFPVLCPGDQDSTAFQIPFTLAINHPDDPKRDLIKTAAPIYDIKLKKPDCTINPIVMMGEWLKSLRSKGFVVNDAITVSVTLHSDRVF